MQRGKRPSEAERTSADGRGAATVRIAELVSSGAGVLVVCADASRRAGLAAAPAVSLASTVALAHRLSSVWRRALTGLSAKFAGGLALTDYAAIERAQSEIARSFEHVVLVDPPTSVAAEGSPRCRAGTGRRRSRVGVDASELAGGSGYLHRAWGGAEVDFTIATLAAMTPRGRPSRPSSDACASAASA